MCNTLLIALLHWNVTADKANWFVGLSWPYFAMILSVMVKCWPQKVGVKPSGLRGSIFSTPLRLHHEARPS